jgi:hypothetical protein
MKSAAKKKTGYPFEHAKKPLLDIKSYRKRQILFFTYSLLIISISLGIGMAGYGFFAHMNWVNSFYNSAMILTGMGPAEPLLNNNAKVFAGFYSLFSGVIFLSTVAVMFAPVLHRFMHRIHIESEADKGQG